MMASELGRELHDFWCSFEATIGFKSTFSAMLAAHAGVALGAGAPTGWDPYAERIDAIASGHRTYRALRRMRTEDVVVLYRLYGPWHPSYRHDQLGDLAPLAALTDAAEEARCDLVLRESTRRSDESGARVAVDVVQRRREAEVMFWSEVGQIAKARDQRRIDAGWVLLGQLLDAFEADGEARARIGAIESVDREVTVETSLRARLRARDAPFVAEVTREAIAMRNAATEAYRRARAEQLSEDREITRARAQTTVAESGEYPAVRGAA